MSYKHVHSNSMFPSIKESPRTTTPTELSSSGETENISFSEYISLGDIRGKQVKGNKPERRISVEDLPSMPKDAIPVRSQLHTRRKTIAAEEPYIAFGDKRFKQILKGNKPGRSIKFGELPSIPEDKNPFLSQLHTRRTTLAVVEPYNNTRKFMKNALIVEQGVPVTKHTYEHKRSLSTVTKGARRLSLGSLGSKITGLAHAKNAFNRFKKHSAIQPENDEVETFEIKQLPEKPRFASTLSPEAQFAIMKGYEDLVYWNLCKQYPQHRRQLHRTQTPHSPVVVRYSDPSITDTLEKKNLYDANYDKGRGIPVTSGGVASNSDEQCDQATEQMTLSNTSTKTNSLSQCEATYNKTPTQTTQENSKLITTYMCESVMHILDDLREEQGLYRLSPRRPGMSSLSEPYRVYNSWSRGWSKGFESV